MGWFERRVAAVSAIVLCLGLWITLSGWPVLGITIIVLGIIFLD